MESSQKNAPVFSKKIPLGPTKINIQHGRFTSKNHQKKYTVADIEAHFNNVSLDNDASGPLKKNGARSLSMQSFNSYKRSLPKGSTPNGFGSKPRSVSLRFENSENIGSKQNELPSRHSSMTSSSGKDSDLSFDHENEQYFEPRFVYDVNCVVFVGNVSPNTTQDMLSSFFSKFGLVKSVNLKNSITGRNRKDYAFIKFLVPESVQKVLNFKEPLELDGVVLEVKPRAGFLVNQIDVPISQQVEKPNDQHVEEKDTFRTILVENIPQRWSPQFFFQCFTAYGKTTGCFMYDDVDEHNMKKGLIEMSHSRTAALLCQNTGFLLLPNNVTVKLTLTSITDFNGWVKKHSEWMSYQQMWANYCVPMVPNVGLIPHPPNPIPATEVLPEIKKAGVVKVSNVDIKAFKNSDEIFKTFANLFGPIETSAIASIDSDSLATVIFKVQDLNEAKKVKKDFDWYTFPGTVPEVEFP